MNLVSAAGPTSSAGAATTVAPAPDAPATLAFQQSHHQDRPYHGGIAQHLRKSPALRGRDEFPPGDSFLIGAAAQAPQ